MTSTSDTAVSAAPHPAAHRRLGVPAVTFMIVAASAPLTVLAGGVTTTFAVTGVLGVPLSFLLLGAVLAIFAVGYAAMSRYVTNAGAFYSYVSQGIGRPPASASRSWRSCRTTRCRSACTGCSAIRSPPC
ncbi:hypothetical protein [Leifsonia sp. TF02-11]|uniref:hypothetical protein n=1 Tax=Leifsonia sp. TF02-11 TaxID=2815212 RepID=UPI0027DE2E8F|nr:hypothetical protein [Leifsonia sp. TF02-11]